MSKPAVVADTSPLINLAGIGRVGLLSHLYGTITIPRQVLDEFTSGSRATDPNLQVLPLIADILAEAGE